MGGQKRSVEDVYDDLIDDAERKLELMELSPKKIIRFAETLVVKHYEETEV